MQVTKFKRKSDGSEGYEYTPQKGDKYIAKFSAPRQSQMTNSKYPKWTLGVVTVETNPKEVYIKLTAGQAKGLLAKGDIKGKTITFEEYENSFSKATGKKFLGARVQ